MTKKCPGADNDRGTYSVVISVSLKPAFYLLFLSVSCCLAQQKNDNPDFYLSTLKKKLNVILEAAQFEAGDTIADVGAGLGWFDAAIGIYRDSLVFYLEDIDSAFVKNERLTEAISTFSKFRGSRIECRYHWVIGDEKSTGLPDGFVDKVLLIDTYHHIQYREDMIRDIVRILKPNGELVVMEPVGRKRGQIYKGCFSVIFTPEEIISSFSAHGLIHLKTLKTVKSTRKRVRVFVFARQLAGSEFSQQ